MVVVVVLLFYVHGKHLRSCRDGQLTEPHFSWAGLDLLSVNQYFVHILSPVTETALLEKAEGETKVCGQTGYRTQDP